MYTSTLFATPCTTIAPPFAAVAVRSASQGHSFHFFAVALAIVASAPSSLCLRRKWRRAPPLVPTHTLRIHYPKTQRLKSCVLLHIQRCVDLVWLLQPRAHQCAGASLIHASITVLNSRPETVFSPSNPLGPAPQLSLWRAASPTARLIARLVSAQPGAAWRSRATSGCAHKF
jgi:hypothetical protein